ncbi:hypothetical protein [Methylobacterium sp. A54F]
MSHFSAEALAGDPETLKALRRHLQGDAAPRLLPSLAERFGTAKKPEPRPAAAPPGLPFVRAA